MISSPHHRQTWVKVNAPVDEGVAALVEALSAIPKLETLESCEGEPGHARAFVIFRYRDWRTCGALLFERLLPILSPDMRASVTLTLCAYDANNVVGDLRAESTALSGLVEELKKIAR